MTTRDTAVATNSQDDAISSSSSVSSCSSCDVTAAATPIAHIHDASAQQTPDGDAPEMQATPESADEGNVGNLSAASSSGELPPRLTSSAAVIHVAEVVPDEYKCPITREIMRDPVCASDGHTYERMAIEEWVLFNSSRKKAVISPKTQLPLSNHDLRPNYSIRSLIAGMQHPRAHPSTGSSRNPTDDDGDDDLDGGCLSSAMKQQLLDAPDVMTLKMNKSFLGLVRVIKHCNLSERSKAARAIGALAYKNAENRRGIEQAGGVPALIELLKDSHAEGKNAAAVAIMNLAVANGLEIQIAEGGGIPLLVDLLQCGDSNGRRLAAGALRNLAAADQLETPIARAGGITALIKLLQDGSSEGKRQAAGALRNLAIGSEHCKHTITQEHGILPLIQLLQDGSDEAKREAAAALSTVAYKNNKNKQVITDFGGIPPLIQLLQDGSHPEGRTNAAGALRNLAVGSKDRSHLIMKKGGIPPLIQLLNSSDEATKRESVAVCRNLMVESDACIQGIVQAGGISPLMDLIQNGSEEAKKEAAAALVTIIIDGDSKSPKHQYLQDVLNAAPDGTLPPQVAEFLQVQRSNNFHGAKNGGSGHPGVRICVIT